MRFLVDGTASEEKAGLVGLRISAGLLAGAGCVSAIFPIFFALLLIMFAVPLLTGGTPTLRSESWPQTLAGMCVTAAITYSIFRAASALRNEKRWAAYVALLIGLIFLLFSLCFVSDIYHPDRLGPDGGFLIFLLPFCFPTGLWWWVYLNLPHVRRRLRRLDT